MIISSVSSHYKKNAKSKNKTKKSPQIIPSRGIEIIPSRDIEIIPSRGIEIIPSRGIEIIPSRDIEIIPSRGIEIEGKKIFKWITTQSNIIAFFFFN